MMKKLALMAMLPLVLNEPFLPPQRVRREPEHKKLTRLTDEVLRRLVSGGICFVDRVLFEKLHPVLQSKLRGRVLFHSDIKSKKIFITYEKTGI